MAVHATTSPTRPAYARDDRLGAAHSIASSQSKPGVEAPARDKPLSLRRNSSWALVGNVVNAASQWGVVIVLARLGSPELVGLFALGLAVTAPIVNFLNMRLRDVLATDAGAEYSLRHYVTLRFLSGLASIGATALVSLVLQYSMQTLVIIVAIGCMKFTESLSDILYGFFQRQERMDRIATSIVIKGPLSLCAFAITIWLGGGVLGGVLAMIAVKASTFFAYDALQARDLAGRSGRAADGVARPDDDLTFRWDGGILASLAWRSLPLGVVVLLTSLNASIPRFFIEAQMGERWLGVFASMAYFLIVSATFVDAMGQPVCARLARYFAERRLAEFRILTLKLMAAVMLVSLSAIGLSAVGGRAILTLTYGAEFADCADVFVWLMAAQFFLLVGGVLGCAITATRRFHRFAVPYSMTTVVAAVASAVLIPRFGLLGAAWTTGLIGVASCIAPLVILASIWRAP